MTDLMDTFVENRWIVHPNHANSHERVHGGNVMKWMDEIGAMATMRFAGQRCVTVEAGRVSFQQPVPVGDLVVIEAYVYDTGRSSVKVRLQAFHENPFDGTRKRTTESFFTYVAIDEDMQPSPVPELTTSTEEGKRLRRIAREHERNGGEAGGRRETEERPNDR